MKDAKVVQDLCHVRIVEKSLEIMQVIQAQVVVGEKRGIAPVTLDDYGDRATVGVHLLGDMN